MFHLTFILRLLAGWLFILGAVPDSEGSLSREAIFSGYGQGESRSFTHLRLKVASENHETSPLSRSTLNLDRGRLLEATISRRGHTVYGYDLRNVSVTRGAVESEVDGENGIRALGGMRDVRGLGL